MPRGFHGARRPARRRQSRRLSRGMRPMPSSPPAQSPRTGPVASRATRASFNFDFSAISTFGPYRAAFITGVPVAAARARPTSSIRATTATAISPGPTRFRHARCADQSEPPHAAHHGRRQHGAHRRRAKSRVIPRHGVQQHECRLAGLERRPVQRAQRFLQRWAERLLRCINGTVSTIRQVIDIAAPGENVSTAYYGGETGGNGPSLSGPANGPAGGPDDYTRSISGTSFASPPLPAARPCFTTPPMRSSPPRPMPAIAA